MAMSPTNLDLERAAALAVAFADGDMPTVDETLAPLATGELHRIIAVLAANVRVNTPLRLHTAAVESVCSEATRRAAALYRIPPTAILGRQQTQHIVNARHVAMHASRICGLSLTQIGREFRRDHTTVSHASGRVGELPQLREAASRIAWQILGQRPATEMTDPRVDEADDVVLEVAG